MPPLKPEPEWKIVRPGLIALSTTGYRIEYYDVTGTYMVTLNDQYISEVPTLGYAKLVARDHMQDRRAMGYEA